MSPACPRCSAPLCSVHGAILCRAITPDGAPCRYGHDAPRSLIPEPDVPVGVAQEFATREGICGKPHGPGGWKYCAECCAWVFSPPAPTPQRTDAGGVAKLSRAQAESDAEIATDLATNLRLRNAGMESATPNQYAEWLEEIAIRAEAYAAKPINTIPYMRALLEAAGESWGDWCEESIGEMGKFLADRLAETQSTPTPAANAKSVGVDEGMWEVINYALSFTSATLRGVTDPTPQTLERLRRVDEARAAILASHEIVRRPQ